MKPGMILRVEMTQEGVWCEIKKVKKNHSEASPSEGGICSPLQFRFSRSQPSSKPFASLQTKRRITTRFNGEI